MTKVNLRQDMKGHEISLESFHAVNNLFVQISNLGVL